MVFLFNVFIFGISKIKTKMIYPKKILLILCIFLFSKCTSKNNDGHHEKILGTQKELASEWIIENFNQPIQFELRKSSYFSIQGDLSGFEGSTGCNSFSGKINTAGTSIAFRDIIKMDRTCDYEQQEILFLEVLRVVDNFKIQDKKLLLYHKEKLMITFNHLYS
jgi:heat shock protein HslJ